MSRYLPYTGKDWQIRCFHVQLSVWKGLFFTGKG